MMIAVSYPRGIQEGSDFRDQYRAVAAGVIVFAARVAKAANQVGQIAVSRSWKGIATPIIMLKNDFDRGRYDDSCKLIVLELILLRRLGHHSFEMKAILKHAATTMNALETTDSTRARELIVMRAKNSLLIRTVFGGGIPAESKSSEAAFYFFSTF